MKIFLVKSFKDLLKERFAKDKPYILESFYKITPDSGDFIEVYGDYMLDFGAFSMLQGTARKMSIAKYLQNYIDYINTYKVKKYFELDIDSLIGYDEVKKIRNYLYQKTGVPPIPVWHKSRGIEDYKVMCKNYKYVAIGGYVTKELTKWEINQLPHLIRYAHRNGAKIHGLGFTALNKLSTCHFDSVDSATWTTGNRFGHVFKFTGKTMIRILKPKNTRVNFDNVVFRNYGEWIKFQHYAEDYL